MFACTFGVLYCSYFQYWGLLSTRSQYVGLISTRSMLAASIPILSALGLRNSVLRVLGASVKPLLYPECQDTFVLREYIY